MTAPKIPTIDDIEQAAERLAPYAVRTPLIEHPALNDVCGGRVFLKAENLQRSGSFKFRGAYNAVSQVDKARFPGGVVAASSGNHAQGIAAAATLCGLQSVVVMPSDAPAMKVARTRAFGAEVVLYDRATGDRTAIAQDLCKARNAAFVHPFDNAHVISGQGTAGLEIVEQLQALGVTPDQVCVCCAGGGLTTGVAIALKAGFPAATVHSVEPADFDDFARSLVAGEILANARKSGSICDALLVDRPGVLNFEIGRKVLSRGLVVSDAEAMQAVGFAFRELKLVVEPGGAVALAAALTGKLDTRDRVTVCVLSGGNVDPETFTKAIA